MSAQNEAKKMIEEGVNQIGEGAFAILFADFGLYPPILSENNVLIKS